MRAYKLTAFILIICIVCMVLCSCGFVIHETQDENESVDINPLPEDEALETVFVNLYFGYAGESYLVCETREIDMTINEKNEITVLKNLIAGTAENNTDYTVLINPDTRIIDVSDSSGYLFVTLSKEFLSAPDDFVGAGMSENMRRYLAVYSVINTLIEYGGYERVQIMIDRDSTGSGTPITNRECGIEGDAIFEPHGRNNNIILDAENTVKQIMSALEMKDWKRLYDFIAYSDSEGADRPTYNEFINELSLMPVTLSDISIIDEAWPTSNNTRKVFVSYNIKIGDAEMLNKSNVSVDVIRERGRWKITYSDFKAAFIDVE